MSKKILKYILAAVATLVVAAGCKNYYQQQLENGNVSSKTPNLPLNFRLSDDPEVVVDIPTPENVKATKGESNSEIKIHWSKISYKGKEITDYYVYRSSDNKNFIRLQKIDSPRTSNEFIDKIGDAEDKVQPGIVYSYAVKAVISDSKGVKHTSLLSFRDEGYLLSLPKGIEATFRTYDDRIVLSWDKALGASYYMVARLDTKDEPVSEDTNVYKYAVRGTEFIDMRDDLGGDRKAGETYYYKVRAHYDSYNMTSWSNAYGGSILSPGAPAKVKGLQISKGTRSDKIVLSWLNQDNVEEYKIYREESADGEFVEPLKLKKKVTTNSFEDTSIEDGKTYYYRVCGINSNGPGRLSDFDKFAHDGYNLAAPVKASALIGYLEKESLIIVWDKVKGASKYALWQSGPYEEAISGYQEADLAADFTAGWTRIHTAESFLTSNKYDADMVADGKFYYYKVVPLHNDYPVPAGDDGYDALADNAFKSDIEDFKGKAKLIEFKADAVMPVQAEIVSVSQKDYDLIGKVAVNIKFSSDISDEFMKLYSNNLTSVLEKTCSYGFEEGGSYGDLPNDDIRNKTSPMKGKPHKINKYIYSIGSKFLKSGECQIIDEYKDFDKDGNLINAPEFTMFSYRWWDREAWKDIVRQKPFNMERAVKSNYKVTLKWKNASGEYPQTASAEKSGYPAISNRNFAELCIWMKDMAINRLWELRGAAMCTGYSTGDLQTLLEASRTYDGENEGSIGWTCSVSIMKLAGEGEVFVNNYSDWTGFKLNFRKNIRLYIKINIGKPSPADIEGTADLTTPLYSGSFYMKYNAEMAISQYEGINSAAMSVTQSNRPSQAISDAKALMEVHRAPGDQGKYNGDWYTTINNKHRYGYSTWPKMYGTSRQYIEYGYYE